MSQQIIGVKLNSGEEIIAKVVSYPLIDGADYFNIKTGFQYPPKAILEDIRVLNIQQVSADQVALMLAPWIIGNQQTSVELNLASIAQAVYPPSANIEANYIQQTSRIALASAGSVPGL
jgi:hypothetical protein